MDLFDYLEYIQSGADPVMIIENFNKINIFFKNKLSTQILANILEYNYNLNLS